ncbi:MAG: zinc ribbon domain-containing protein [Coleofasciculus sp. B1-GNL1-01]|uniref:zinc ribbon domain-containing protein n=1 Tax=Coleofasciculus sp. B1-GNL1-01 TaxID=3068484 RepID=UPI0032F2F00E
MKLVEKHVVRQGTRKWKEIDDLAFKSKNLYNRANYEIRQHFFKTHQILSYNEMASRMRLEESYCALPRKVNNQNFTSVPHARLIKMLTYKAERVGIKVIITEESYTSVASFLDGDCIPVHGSPEAKTAKFSGRRVKRGLYQSKIGVKFNADINGSYNIIRKVVPDAFGNGIEGVVVHPVKITLAN